MPYGSALIWPSLRSNLTPDPVGCEIPRRSESDSVSVSIARRPELPPPLQVDSAFVRARLEREPAAASQRSRRPASPRFNRIHAESARPSAQRCHAGVAEDTNAEVRSTASPVEPGFTASSKSVAPTGPTGVELSSRSSQERVAESPASRRQLRFTLKGARLALEPGVVRSAIAAGPRLHSTECIPSRQSLAPRWHAREPRAPGGSQVDCVARRARGSHPGSERAHVPFKLEARPVPGASRGRSRAVARVGARDDVTEMRSASPAVGAEFQDRAAADADGGSATRSARASVPVGGCGKSESGRRHPPFPGSAKAGLERRLSAVFRADRGAIA